MHECASVCACIGSRVCVCVCARTRHRFPRDVTAGLASPSVMLRWRRASSVAAAVRVRALSRCARHTHSSPLFFPKFGYGKRQHFFPPYLVMWRRASVQEQLSDAVQTSRFFFFFFFFFFFPCVGLAALVIWRPLSDALPVCWGWFSDSKRTRLWPDDILLYDRPTCLLKNEVRLQDILTCVHIHEGICLVKGNCISGQLEWLST